MPEEGAPLPIPHFTALPLNDPDDPNEQLKYDCSLCDWDIFNLSWHAQHDHGVRTFTVDNEPKERERGVPGSTCGINGCTFDGNHDGRHSWMGQDSE